VTPHGREFFVLRPQSGRPAEYSRVAGRGTRGCFANAALRLRSGQGDTLMPKMSKFFHKNGLVPGFQKRQTEYLKLGTNQNVTNGPVSPDLLGSKVSLL
jgi:hypothetical protein